MDKVISIKTKVVLCIIAALYSLSFYFWKLPYCWDLDVDMYFWFNHCQFYGEDIMNTLSLFVANAWISIWGHNMTMYRILGWLCSILSITVPYYFLQDKNGRRENLHFLALGIWLFGYGTWGMYNNDTLSLLCLSLLTTLVIKLNSCKLFNLAILSLVTSLAAASRFPNIVAIFPVCLFFIFRPDAKRSRWIISSVAYLVLTLCFYVLIVGGLTGNFNVLASFKEAMSANMEGSHNLNTLIKIYVSSFYKSVVPFLAAVVFLWIVKKTKLTDKNIVWVFVAVLIMTAALLLLYKRVNWIYWPFYSYCVIALLLTIIFKSVKADGIKERKVVPYLFVLLMIVIPIAGSDTGMMKLFLLSSCFSPIVFINVKDKLGSRLGKGMAITAILLSSLFYYKDLVFYKHEDPRFEIKEYMSDFERYGKKDKTIFYGYYKASHEMYFRENTELLYNCSFWQRTEAEMDEVLNLMKADKEIVLFDFSKSDKARQALSGESYDMVKESENVIIYNL